MQADDSFLKSKSTQEWLDCVMSDFDHFLIDHAACERKASAMCMSFVVKYPDRKPLIDIMIRLAREELQHFHEVFHLLEQRGLKLGPDVKDEYINDLISQCRNGREERLIDRLIICGIVEARGWERFSMIADALTDEKLAKFYDELARSEHRHYLFFTDLAKSCAKGGPLEKSCEARIEELLDYEAKLIERLPLRPILH